tara:strand:+ start:1823 stop:3001 length:1179 start_codon:yes stop_codon:yes gene_type:complete
MSQLRQILSADKLSIGFFLGAGCPCSVRIQDPDGTDSKPIIPAIQGLTDQITSAMLASDVTKGAFEKIVGTLEEDGHAGPSVEAMLNRIRSFRDVAGNAGVRGLSNIELESLDRAICARIRTTMKCDLPTTPTAYQSLAKFIGRHRFPPVEVFTTNYDVLFEQALEREHVPFFDGFVGSSRPFFDQRAIEEDSIPKRWSRLWKIHGSINWRSNRLTKSVFRSDGDEDDELLIHPSHLKYNESRRMPYLVLIDRLRNFLRRSDHPVALILSGYSFGDEHINEAIIESLKANSSAACFAFQFSKLSQYPVARALALENSNLTVLAEDGAVVRRQEGNWLARPESDRAMLSGAFEFKEVGQEGQEQNQNIPCHLKLGDFAELGNLLDQFVDGRVQ